MNRRIFLQAGALSISTIPCIGQDVKKDKSIIHIHLGGGASHIETFDPKPDATSEIRSVNGFVEKDGIQIGGIFQNLIKHSDKLNIVRSFSHENNSHSQATHWLMTGYNLLDNSPSAMQKEPSYGSVVSSLSNRNLDGMPNYVRLNKIEYDESSWLGVKCSPYDARGEGVDNLKLKVGQDRFLDRKGLLKLLESNTSEWTQIQSEAYNVLSGKASEAFDLTREGKGKYIGDFGQSCLLARRLVERGTKYVTIHHGGWDMHSEIKKGFENRGADLDINLSVLIDDIWSRGLKKSVLIIVAGEFGRTYKINATGGRDHWSKLSPLMFIGGDYNSGRIIGKSSKDAAEPLENVVRPKDITKTIFNHFSFDETVQRTDNFGRPRYLVQEESKVIL